MCELADLIALFNVERSYREEIAVTITFVLNDMSVTLWDKHSAVSLKNSTLRVSFVPPIIRTQSLAVKPELRELAYSVAFYKHAFGLTKLSIENCGPKRKK